MSAVPAATLKKPRRTAADARMRRGLWGLAIGVHKCPAVGIKGFCLCRHAGLQKPLDQGRNGNFGFHEGVNFGMPLGYSPISFQVGFQRFRATSGRADHLVNNRHDTKSTATTRSSYDGLLPSHLAKLRLAGRHCV